MILSRLLEIYLCYAGSILLHEIFHFICACSFNANIIRVKIGEDFFAIKSKKISVSPIICRGYVEVEENFLDNQPHKVIIFFLAGSIANLLIIIATLIFASQYELKNIVIMINIMVIVFSLFPMFKENDAKGIILYLKKRK